MVGEESDVLLQQAPEHAALVVRHDAVADAQENDGVAVVGESADHEQQERQHGDLDHAREIFLHVGLIDDIANQVGGERGAGRAERHQHEGEHVALPPGKPVLRQQTANQRGCRMWINAVRRRLFGHPEFRARLGPGSLARPVRVFQAQKAGGGAAT